MVVNLSEVKQHPPDETRTPFKLARRHIPLVTSYLERSHRLFKSGTTGTIFSSAATMYVNGCSQFTKTACNTVW